MPETVQRVEEEAFEDLSATSGARPDSLAASAVATHADVSVHVDAHVLLLLLLVGLLLLLLHHVRRRLLLLLLHDGARAELLLLLRLLLLLLRWHLHVHHTVHRTRAE